jgi:hypothetical protein
MSKRKLDQISGHNLWDIEEAFYINHRGVDPDMARTIVVFRWLWHGDLRPLAAAINEGHQLEQAVLNLLANLIGEDRVTIKPRKRGSPRKPDKSARNIVAALAYENHSGKSKEAFAETPIGAISNGQTAAAEAWAAGPRN